MTIRIRAVDGGSDRFASLLRYLQLEALPGDEPMDTDKGHWWVAYEGSLPVAFAGLIESQQVAKWGYLCRAGVLPSHRGLGLQAKLIKVREAKAKRLGMVCVVTDTYDNPYSSNNLIKSGYRMMEPPLRYAAEGTNYWHKPLP